MQPNISDNEKLEHDIVVAQSAGTYRVFQSKGIAVDYNPGTIEKIHNRYVGPPHHPFYPDVVVWKPSSLNPTAGTAIAIEEIETPSTLPYGVEKWKEFSSLGVPFTLIVPEEKRAEAESLIKNNNINISVLQTYQYNPQQGFYAFKTIKK